MAKLTIAELSIETTLLVERLQRVEVGELVLYKELGEICGRDVQLRGRCSLTSARRICQRDRRMVFEAVVNEGVRRLDDGGIVATGAVNLKRIGRKARRGVTTLACIADFDALPDAAKVDHNTSMSLMGALGQMTKKRNVERLREGVANAQARLPLSKTLEMFGNGKKE